MMQATTMQYKGYMGSVEVDTKENILFGKLLHIKDLVNYEAETPAALELAFKEAVDDYLKDCKDQGVEPDLPFKGQFNVRIDPGLHRSLAMEAKRLGKSMNDYVEAVLHRHKVIDSSDWRATRVAHFALYDTDVDAIHLLSNVKWQYPEQLNQVKAVNPARAKYYA